MALGRPKERGAELSGAKKRAKESDGTSERNKMEQVHR